MFIRTKFIKGNPYAYLVENKWKKKGSRQKVSRYLGRIYTQEELPEPEIQTQKPATIIKQLIDQETRNADIKVDLKKRTVRKGDKAVVISLNGGYLCDTTLKELFRALHIRNEERPGTALAEAISRAGLRIPQHAFIALYQHHRK